MAKVILDCYTDEPAGLGVPPYLGTYPRYLYGYLKERYSDEIYYLTIDDLRLFKKYGNKKPETRLSEKTNISIHNLTKNSCNIKKILQDAEKVYVILGVHVPGKYLTAVPGTLNEVGRLIEEINAEKILTGPAVYGTQLFGGRFFEKSDLKQFHHVMDYKFDYKKIDELSARGSEVVKQLSNFNYKIMEIETGRGCKIGKCSFCMEPLKREASHRDVGGILNEIKLLYDLGERHFRFGKQSCFYSYPDAVELLERTRAENPRIKTLHIDNVNPVFVNTSKGIKVTEAVVKYCTSGNVAAFGVESFDPEVIAENHLNCSPETAIEAIKTINEYGAERGANGMPRFLPGINLIFGLCRESKKTHEYNIVFLREILLSKLLLRRINIRQVSILPGTEIEKKCRNKYLKKNKKYYWKWRNQIRQEIDCPMLKMLVPNGTVLKECIAEVYDGKTTFLRQIGAYPLIVGVKTRLELGRFYDLKITGHMLRSIVGEVSRQY